MITNLKIQKTATASRTYVLHGLSLPPAALKAIQNRGIYCVPGISIEHQHLARRNVLRGIESGGAVADMGRACAYLSSDGNPLPWLQSIDSIAVNGRHAIILAQSLVRIEMLRTLRTYQLILTRHDLSVSASSTRPEISSRLLFRGEDGVLPVDLWSEENMTIRGQLAPTFYSRSGEVINLPERFETAIRKITGAVCCVGCRHTHIAVPPAVQEN